MRGKLTFVAGAAIGFVLGARAGRERYEDLMARAKKVMENPSVREARGAAKSQASTLYSQGKEAVTDVKVGEKLPFEDERRACDERCVRRRDPPADVVEQLLKKIRRPGRGRGYTMCG